MSVTSTSYIVVRHSNLDTEYYIVTTCLNLRNCIVMKINRFDGSFISYGTHTRSLPTASISDLASHLNDPRKQTTNRFFIYRLAVSRHVSFVAFQSNLFTISLIFIEISWNKQIDYNGISSLLLFREKLICNYRLFNFIYL